MRTKSRAVRRRSIHENLEGDGSVGIRIGVSGSGHDVNGHANSGTIVQGFDGDAPLTGSVNANWVGTGDVAATLGMFMDVDDELRSVNGTVDTPSSVTAAVAASLRSSNGIIINEPHLCHSTVTNTRTRFSATVDVVGKGKRKVGDVPASVDNGAYYAAGHCTPDIPFIGGCVADSRSASCTYIAAPAAATDVQDNYRSPGPIPSNDCLSVSPGFGPQPETGIVRSMAISRPEDGTSPSTRPSTSSTVGRARYSTTRRRQTRAARAAAGDRVPEHGHRGAPPEYVSLGLCNQVCRHCKALFWLEEKLTRSSTRSPEYHKCCMGGRVVLRPQPETARDMLEAGNVPEFKIRLFAVAGARQYELPSGDSIGAIVYEGGPNTGTEYDVVIHRRAGDPERPIIG
ncbi:DNA helicase [Artemisia annua]|uniref:DNA helicase n=1 Tax=Artemisia annua TaxID=35608 RepID=A0A2U1LGC0_ARTAN|nr:DNA helicase [Artemisia annua]